MKKNLTKPFLFTCWSLAAAPVLAESADLSHGDKENLASTMTWGRTEPIFLARIDDDETATPPTPVTGTYLAGWSMPSKSLSSGSSLDLGLRLYLDSNRLSESKAHYEVRWKVSLKPESPISVNELSSEDTAYDRIFRFEAVNAGTLNAQLRSIQIEVQVLDLDDPDQGATITKISLKDLLAGERPSW